MKIKTDTKLVDFKGKELKEAGGVTITIGDVVSNNLSLSADNPARCYKLAKLFAQEKEVEVLAEDIVFIKEILEKSKISALFSGQVIQMLEGN